MSGLIESTSVTPPNDYGYYDLTPIERHGDFLFKRDDLYKPFPDFEITGGKVRQCLYLVHSNLAHIKSQCDSTIATAASVHSPQAVIVSRVAKQFGLKSIIGVGTDKPFKHRAMQMCAELGSEVTTLVTSNAYNSVLYSRLQKMRRKRKFFVIDFGYQVTTDVDAIIGMNSNQVRNVPPRLDNLVINVGSGVSAKGILHGISLHCPQLFKQKRICLIQPFGYDRSAEIGGHYMRSVKYNRPTYPYKQAKDVRIGALKLDEIYEAKAFDRMTKLKLKGDTLFWIIGDSNVLRKAIN